MSTRTKAAKSRRKDSAPHANGVQPSDKRDLTPIPNHPLADLFGKHADDPAWDELMEAIRENRERERLEDACEE